MCKYLHEFFIETVPDPSLHETSDLTQAIEVLIVEATLMLKAVKNYHYNKKKKTLQQQGIRHLEEYVFYAFMPVFCVLTMEVFQGVIPCVKKLVLCSIEQHMQKMTQSSKHY